MKIVKVDYVLYDKVGGAYLKQLPDKLGFCPKATGDSTEALGFKNRKDAILILGKLDYIPFIVRKRTTLTIIGEGNAQD